jgi:hypothetical protein
MTREEIKNELSDVLLDLGGLSFPDVNDLLEGDSAITFEGEDLIKIAEHFYNLPRKGLWDAKKIVDWILNNYGTYEQTYTDNSGNHTYSDFQIGQFIRNLREAMEE